MIITNKRSSHLEAMSTTTVYRVSAVLLLVLALSQLPAISVGQQTNQCTSTFLTIFGQCLTNSTPSINFQNFLWLTRDGNMGTKPADLPTFTQQVCSVKNSLYDCGATQVGRIEKASSTLCTDVDKSNIQQFFRNVFRKLNSSCSHPCRAKLVSSLRACFETADVIPDLFLPNVTVPRNSLLGNTEDNITAFCDKKDEVIDCMRTNTVMCPDTRIVLPATGLDLDALNETVILLCDNRRIYLRGVRCSENRTAAEEACQTTLVNQLADLENQFQNINISFNVYSTDICRLRLDNIRCDLNAMANRAEGKCDDVILGLRREQECKLIPAFCKTEFSDRLIDMCNPKLFSINDRSAYVSSLVGGGSENLTQSSVIIVVALMAAAILERTLLI